MNCIAIGRLVVEPSYCNTQIVLQLGCVVRLENCIARHQGVLQYSVCFGRKLYCKRRLEGLRIVLQYAHCIVTRRCIAVGWKCIAIGKIVLQLR